MSSVSIKFDPRWKHWSAYEDDSGELIASCLLLVDIVDFIHTNWPHLAVAIEPADKDYDLWITEPVSREDEWILTCCHV